jgi:hypothetical protein
MESENIELILTLLFALKVRRLVKTEIKNNNFTDKCYRIYYWKAMDSNLKKIRSSSDPNIKRRYDKESVSIGPRIPYFAGAT